MGKTKRNAIALLKPIMGGKAFESQYCSLLFTEKFKQNTESAYYEPMQSNTSF